MLRATAALLCLLVAAPAAADPAALGDAFRALERGDYENALARGRALDRAELHNTDYVDYVVAQAAFLTGRYRLARRRFRTLSRDRDSRFRDVAGWRLADCDWQLGRRQAARKAYLRLVKNASRRHPDGDVALARFRVAEAEAARGRTARAVAGFREVVREHPAHPLAPSAQRRLRELGEPRDLSADERIARAERLTDAHLWREAIHELDQIGDGVALDVQRRRDYQMGRTLFKMRRQYELAGRLLLAVWPHLRGDDRVWALFHGARALSRAHHDEEAIGWYQKVVEKFPREKLAAEAQYLSGWLQFNLGNYREAIEPLARTRSKYRRSRWADDALWYQALSHYLLGEYERAMPLFEKLEREGGRLVGNKGRYWRARSLQQLGRTDDAVALYREAVAAHPFSWYALLARARLEQAGHEIGPFGDDPRDPDDAPPLDEKLDEKLARDPLIRRVDELIAADLGVEAGVELRRGERAFVKRHGRAAGLAMALDRYRKAGNYNRPWMIAVVYGNRRALDAPPKGRARIWWEHAYPKAYESLVEKHRELGDNPPYYLYAIMRKESGFDPHTVSYADALGLLQMIPPTTRRVAKALGVEYTPDLLFDPEMNIRAGSWYIGRLFAKFKRQIPIGSASYNSGPRPVMRWLRENGDRPIDEYVELISFSQARGYGKKVTETYARYLYLYEGEIYEQPLTVDADYVDNDLTY